MMSLPTDAVFLKKNKIVGLGACNIGWYINPEGILGCIYDAWCNAVAHFRVLDPNMDNYSVYQRGKEKESKYFSTPDDLASFEYVLLYEYYIPREFAESVFNGTRTEEEFAEMVDQFKLTSQKFYELKEIIFYENVYE